MKDMVFGERF